ncbi:SUMF1/EgtB/PvdO family nonheme iron enzyme [Spongiivirga sp. MCCC 1A20706]|uniref:formylglycine-generating enzyme family protein n=1 Tax=Spongiivirga sp. MCCC 1A20706 TaxID=3160963 RepID=UPI0039776744
MYYQYSNKIFLISIILIISLVISCHEKEEGFFVGGLEYSFIPQGEFLMGCIPGDSLCWKEELPRRKVQIKEGFWITSTEITVGSFRKFTENFNYTPESQLKNKGRIFQNEINDWVWTSGVTWKNPLMPGLTVPDNYPVAQVSWKDAQKYCECMGGRLPTEAEWEYAARAGLENQLFTWGNKWIPVIDGVPQTNGPDITTKAIYSKMSIFNDYIDHYATYSPVGSFPPNGYNLYDMSGNVWEWCYDDFYYSRYNYSIDTNPPDSLKRKSKIVRGGTWAYSPEQHRLSERGVFESENFWTASLGFRCVIKKSKN